MDNQPYGNQALLSSIERSVLVYAQLTPRDDLEFDDAGLEV